jgi:alpha-tubulin suppressor-like RCC1 family protein
VVGSALECWGLNASGQVDAGNAATGAFVSPIAVPLGTILPSVVGTGRSHTCAADGSADPGMPVCFGADNADQLGGPGPIDTVALLGPPTTVLAITAGENHTCVLTGLGGVQCFGADDRGQLGNGTTGGVSAAPGYVSGL